MTKPVPTLYLWIATSGRDMSLLGGGLRVRVFPSFELGVVGVADASRELVAMMSRSDSESKGGCELMSFV